MESLLSRTDAGISDHPCCYTYKFFSAVDKKELRKRLRVMLGAPKSTRRAFLGSLYCTDNDCKFTYDGNFVFSNFLLEAFRLTHDLHSSVKMIFLKTM